MSKKRPWEHTPVDTVVVEIFEDLANENESIRHEGTHSLLNVFSKQSQHDRKRVLKRLFRGLCSNRKAARLGFSVALTEILHQLSSKSHDNSIAEDSLTPSYCLEELESSTASEGNGSGQEERDHYLGRLFGAEAILKSGYFARLANLREWTRLLDIICSVAIKKPWLRQQCGWALYNCIEEFSVGLSKQDFAVEIINQLISHKIIRTPEGVAIWLKIDHVFPNAKLPKGIWEKKDPLYKKNLTLLAEVLKDAKSSDKTIENGQNLQGAAFWTPQVHFAWEVVLNEFFKLPKEEPGKKNEKAKHASFKSFWLAAVDESLFALTSSPERKHWGFLLFTNALRDAPNKEVENIFTSRLIKSFLISQKSDDRYLQRSSKKALQAMLQRAKDDSLFAQRCALGLIKGADPNDLDAIIKSKLLEQLIEQLDLEGSQDMQIELCSDLRRPVVHDDVSIARRRSQILQVLAKLLNERVTKEIGDDDSDDLDLRNDDSTVLRIMLQLVENVYEREKEESDEIVPSFAEDTLGLMKTQISVALEKILKRGSLGRQFLRRIVLKMLLAKDKDTSRDEEFDDRIKQLISEARDRLNRLPRNWNISIPEAASQNLTSAAELGEYQKYSSYWRKESTAFTEGLALLYSLVLLQVYNKDPEAVEMIEELLQYSQEQKPKRARNRDVTNTPGTANSNPTDSLIEIILSFASRPSKFFRRISGQIFENFASDVSPVGLESMARILATKEDIRGQTEMFEAEVREDDTEEDEDSEDEGGAEDTERLRNGESVEIESISSEQSSEVEMDNSGHDVMEVESNDGESEDEELRIFDAKLAEALGTIGDKDDDTSDSGSDMDDEQMLALDHKLEEVFRSRGSTTSKKKEQKDAKENITNFKNRVLDLIEIYFKCQSLNPQALDLLLPLLKVARTTKVNQLAVRACKILREYCSRCKGKNVPVLATRKDVTADEAIAHTLELMRQVHIEAGLEGSNARAAACSNASILMAKALLYANVGVHGVVAIYAETWSRQLTEQLTDKNSHIQTAFFSDWNNWCTQAKGQFQS